MYFFLLLLICSSLSYAIPLATTTIGAFPRPSYLSLPDWFHKYALNNLITSQAYELYIKQHADTTKQLDKATHEAVRQQVAWGIDIPSDGEIRRENYIHYHCRHITGIDFNTLTEKVMRNGAWTDKVPTITGPIGAQEPFLPRDYTIAQAATSKPIKITLPGPLTIKDTIADNYYFDEIKLGQALAQALNNEVLALVKAGCTWIQIDEPLFARYPDKALEFGIKHLEQCFAGVPDHVHTVVHICCGYPMYLDQKDYLKANPKSYLQLAAALDASSIKVISIEDAHRRNDRTLFTHFKNTKIILGIIDISSSRVETIEEIKEHIESIVPLIDANRLLIAPDCGFGMLPIHLVEQKLKNMKTAVEIVKKELHIS